MNFILLFIFSNDIIISVITGFLSLVTAYILIRERILKTELEIKNIYNNNKRDNKIIDNKIKDLINDITDIKDIDKINMGSLQENASAIRELKVILNLLKEQLGIKAIRKLKNSIKDD